MEVILKDEVISLGYAGSVVNVKGGFARNYLIPQKLAVKKTKESLRVLEKQKEALEKIAQQKEAEYKLVLEKIQSLKEITITAKAGESGKLFGTITGRHISDSLKYNDIDVDKKQIVLKDHIKTTGQYSAYINLNRQHKAELNFIVVPE